MDSITELALLLKDRDNPKLPGITTGVVIEPPPNTKISLNDIIVLTNEHLIFSAHVLNSYVRQIKIDNGQVSTMEYVDTLKRGDEVMIIPTQDEQNYYVLDKVVRL